MQLAVVGDRGNRAIPSRVVALDGNSVLQLELFLEFLAKLVSSGHAVGVFFAYIEDNVHYMACQHKSWSTFEDKLTQVIHS